MMNWIGCLALAGLWLVSAAAAGAEPVVNDAQLLRLQKRFPEADENRDGRLTVDEWQAFQASRRLAAEMGEEETRATRIKGDSGKRVPPTHAEIAYGPLPEQRLNLWIAPADKPTPLIVHIHGGGFIQGGKQDTIDAAVQEKLIARGVSYASIQYRFQSADSPLPDVLRGIARAIQFLRFQAGDWNLDKTRFGAFGSSAGAAASVWLGIRDDLADTDHTDPVLRESSRVQAVWRSRWQRPGTCGSGRNTTLCFPTSLTVAGTFSGGEQICFRTALEQYLDLGAHHGRAAISIQLITNDLRSGFQLPHGNTTIRVKANNLAVERSMVQGAQ